MFIYTLIDPKTNLVRYVGKTKNSLRKRLSQHIYKSKYKKSKFTHKENWIRSLLLNGQFPTIKLLEIVTEKNWKDREIYHISKYENLTNLTDGGDSPPILSKKPVAKLDYLTLDIINRYESLSEAEDKNNIKYNWISDSCSGRKVRVGGYLWRYLDKNGNVISPPIPKLRKIGQFSLDLDLLEIYENLVKTGCDPGNISSVCLGKTKSCNGFIWRYLDINNDIIYPNIQYKKKTVSLIEGIKIIKVYENANQTHLDGYNPDLVIKVCKGISSHHRGKKFKFNEY